MKAVHNCLLATLSVGGALLLPAMASSATETVTSVPPPPARVEREPPHWDGYVWTPGYWEWTGHFYHWVPGTLIYERRGAHWVADHWDQLGNQWHFIRGHWEK